jgi:hypothetical protein
MFGVIKNFLNSEKAIASGALVIAASAMVVVGKLTPQEWMDYTQTLLGIYVGGKTVQGAIASLGGKEAGKVAAEAKQNETEAVEKLEELRRWIAANDAEADAAIAAKFGDPSEEPTDPGKKAPTVIVEE